MTTSDRIETLVRSYAGISVSQPIEADTAFAADLAFDSLDLISLAMEIEDEFGITIPDADVDRPDMATLGGVAAYVEGKLAKVDA